MTYGIHFWMMLYKPNQKYSRNLIDKLHSIMIKPLRVSLRLPPNTHQFGVMVDHGLTSLHDLARMSLLRFYQRYMTETLLSDPHLQSITDRLDCGSVPSEHHPSVVRLLQDAHYPRTPNAGGSLIKTKKYVSLGARARFLARPDTLRLLDKATTVASLQSLQLVQLHRETVAAAVAAAAPAVPAITWYLSHAQLAEAARLFTFLQWFDQWHGNHPDHARRTTSPLTLVKREPGPVPLLNFIADKAVLSILMRLRHGRADTQDIQCRFPTRLRLACGIL